MGKRSNFERNPRDFYPTPYAAVIPLIPHLEPASDFVEPCAGDGALKDHLLKNHLHCEWASDIKPERKDVFQRDALSVACVNSQIITNPPWDRKILHPMIDHFRNLAPTWLLFDSDWVHTKQSIPYMPYCHKIVSVGRVSWMGNGNVGKDNCAWYLFDNHEAETIFYGR